MKLVTFNIRLDWGGDGENNFCHRRDMILHTIRQEAPDILCFQEVLPHVALWLKGGLPDYYILGCPRGMQGDDEQTCIAFRRDLFEVLRMESYWLSPTPLIPGSRYPEQSVCPRICTELTLRELRSNKCFRITNTHLDHEGHQSRLLAAEQILNKLKNQDFFPGIPEILTGDMNAQPDAPEIQRLCAVFRNLTEGIGPTYHGFGREAPVQIDYIFASGAVVCTAISKWTHHSDGLWLSDHYPVCAELQL